ncbi:MAG: ABC transporter permease [Acidimicrobiales bacterium]
MAGYIGRRLLAIPPLLLIISIVVFGLIELIPGDQARTIAGMNAPQSTVNKISAQLGLNKPAVVQYWNWLVRALHGNLGHSLFQNSSVSTTIGQRFPVTLSMAVGGLVVILLIGVPAGILAGTHPGSIIDRILTIGSSAAIAIPDFWLAMVLIVLFAVKLHALPAIGYVGITQSSVQWATHLYLPWVALGLAGGATLARQLRSSMVDVLDQEYIRTAEAKGLKRRRVVLKHALKNAGLVPMTIVGLQFAYLLGGTIILEQIFSIEGLGNYFESALLDKDIPVIQGVILVYAVTFVALNLVVDILYGVINPRVRFE